MTTPPWEAAAREAGWLPPDEARLKAWRAANLNGERCRWCGAVRVTLHSGKQQQPHRMYCRFYAGPLKHGFANGWFSTFGYRIVCICGRSYPDYGADGNKNECPDSALAEREPAMADLTATEAPR